MDLAPDDQDDEEVLCDVCEMPVEDCVCDEFDDEEAEEDYVPGDPED